MTNSRPRAMPMLTAIIVAAVVLRVASALWQGSMVESLPGVEDQLSYDMLARQLLAGNGFTFPVNWWPVTQAGEPTAHWSFLYTLYLTAVYGMFGPQPLIARLLQAVIAGVVLPWLTWRVSRRVFGDRVGLVAAAISAVYVYFFYYAGALMTETFYIVSILWTMDCAMRIAAAGRAGLKRWLPWLELGLAMGVAILLRQLFMVVVPVVLFWLWWLAFRNDRRLVGSRAMLVRLAGTIAIVAMLILPWTVRNYLAFGRLVPLNTNSGYAFFWGNHPIHEASFISILPVTGPSYGDLIPDELRGLDEAALDQALLRRGLAFVAQDPVRYALLSLSRIKDYFMFWPSPDSGAVSNVARVASFGLLLPFMIIGLLTARSALRTGPRAAPASWLTPAAGLALLIAFVAVYTAIHLLSWALIRYRLPVDAVLIIFAAVGIEHVVTYLGAVSASRRVQIVEGVGNERTG
jgi:4-amino-4-deoxy-L-arabinose transferase-like glycosyltransferase